ncbi:MAG: glycerol-3-phosphate dehydrogenase/oxidase, partial [Actinomycetota bacterium]|nr:glycerol-3-phosphate dehydrogenase/oxidase [Actinomycetota bacterium]
MRRLETQHLDVLVIGGGVTGIGCALDAASRGLTVAVVEQRDLASGTSSRSSKLIHGGLRYLQQLEFGLVREALSERNLLISQIAPHLINKVDFLYPLRNLGERLYAGIGIALYDLMAVRGGNSLPRHRHLSRKHVQRIAPGLAPNAHRGAIVYSDAYVDDARYVVSLARTAAQFGASILTSTKVTDLISSEGRVCGALVKCLETNRELKVSCGTVVNATGVWSDDIENFVGEDSSRVRASKGIHLVIPRDRINLETGLILRTSESVLFVIPSGTHWIVGTTDTDWQLDRAHPAASKRDIDYLLGTLNRVVENP